MNRVSRGATEYHALANAMESTTPSCSNDWRYIQERDYIDPEDITQMRGRCAECPLLPLCRAYAVAARPSAGMWAGRFWGRRERATQTGDAV